MNVIGWQGRLRTYSDLSVAGLTVRWVYQFPYMPINFVVTVSTMAYINLTLHQGFVHRFALTNLVGKAGFEPTHPKEPDLQSGATLQLRRLPNFTLNSGAGNRNRTRDLLLTRQLLYLLSYTGKLVARIGIEPILTGL